MSSVPEESVLDLGDWPEGQPLLVFGGPYSNLQATEALIEQAQAMDIAPEQCICTGDVVAYCAQPSETIAALREWGCHVLMGNCEESLAQGSDDCGCGFEEGTACSVLSDQWFRFSADKVSEADRLWMGSLPRQIRLTYAGKQFAVVHGSVDQINEFVFASHSEAFFQRQFELAQCDVILGGHSGLPFTKSSTGRNAVNLWHNPGVIGMPANDSQPNTWFSVIRQVEDQLVFEPHPLNYDFKLAQRTMLMAGLVNGYAKALKFGRWPSLDVLPPMEKSVAGMPLTAQPYVLTL